VVFVLSFVKQNGQLIVLIKQEGKKKKGNKGDMNLFIQARKGILGHASCMYSLISVA